MSQKVPFNPKELMAAETSAVAVTFKKLEEKLDKPFEDDESEGSDEESSNDESSEDGSTFNKKNQGGNAPSRVSEEPKVSHDAVLVQLPTCSAVAPIFVGYRKRGLVVQRERS